MTHAAVPPNRTYIQASVKHRRTFIGLSFHVPRGSIFGATNVPRGTDEQKKANCDLTEPLRVKVRLSHRVK